MELALHTNECSLRWDGAALEVPADATLSDYQNAIRVLAQMGKISRIALGDLLISAQKAGIEEQLSFVFEEVGISPVDVSKSIAIASIGKGLRHDSLSEEHYFVASKLNPDEQIKWLDLAVKEGLSALEMKRSIGAGRVLHRDEIRELSGRGSGIVNYHGIVASWDRWKSNIDSTTPMAQWPRETLIRWREDIATVADTIAEADRLIAEME